MAKKRFLSVLLGGAAAGHVWPLKETWRVPPEGLDFKMYLLVINLSLNGRLGEVDELPGALAKRRLNSVSALTFLPRELIQPLCASAFLSVNLRRC